MKVFISTYPFGAVSDDQINILEQNNIEIEYNPYRRKIKPEELKTHLSDKIGLIAGTERIDREILDSAPYLSIIARVGIGIDGIDFEETNRRGILVTYTPDAVSQAVAELTIGNMFNLARAIPLIHAGMKVGKWDRIIGFELYNKKIGIIGFGRIGQRVAKMLQCFSCEILVNDISPDEEMGSRYDVKFCSKEEIYQNADIITIHVPKTPLTINLIDGKVLSSMKSTASIINTSRGGIVNEEDLYCALKSRELASAAMDVYEIEPYISGRLCELDNVILTCHSGSCSMEARFLMEMGAAEEIVRFKNSQPAKSLVPKELIKMEQSKTVIPINAEWHEIANRSIENTNKKYNDYRKRWGQYPVHSIVGSHPLNLDIELVYNQVLDIVNPLDIYFSTTTENSSFMKWDLFMRILDKIDIAAKDMAVSFGFRGNSLDYPQIIEALEAVRKIGSVETRISTSSSSHISNKLIKSLIQKRLDALNIYINYHGMYDNASQKDYNDLDHISQILNQFTKYKVQLGVHDPRIIVFTDIDLSSRDRIKEFEHYWGHWADVIAIMDKFVTSDSNKISSQNINWACSRLWQRIVITQTGEIVACNSDFEGELSLGTFPEIDIASAWNSDKMNWIRDMHLQNKSGDINPCSKCKFRATEINKLRAE